MKYQELIGKCRSCIGCSLLEMQKFKGKYRCENFVDGGKENGREKNTRILYRYKTSKP